MRNLIVSILLLGTSLSGSEYVWSLRFAMDCDISPLKGELPFDYETHPPKPYVDPRNYIHKVHKGDIIWLQSSQIETFYRDVLPHIKKRFILVINDGDDSFPSYSRKKIPVDKLIRDKRVIHIFAQNFDEPKLKGKVSHLPIGLDFHSMARPNGFFNESSQSIQDQKMVLEEILSSLRPTYERKKKALVEFHLSDRGAPFGESRSSIFQRIYKPEIIDILQRLLPRRELWRLKGEYAFSISPPGNGLDCHRTWEDLVLGCIVIVKTSPLDPLYKGLPVVIVKDWSEITEKNLSKWLDRYGDAFTNPSYRKRLTHAYWMNKIRSYK